MTAGMASLNLDASSTEFPFVDDIAFEEVKMLLEMARNRLMVGDVYTSMRYITLAQQVLLMLVLPSSLVHEHLKSHQLHRTTRQYAILNGKFSAVSRF